MATSPLIPLSRRGEKLAALAPGASAVVERVTASSGERLRLLELGFVAGTAVRLIRRAPLGDPVECALRGYRLSLQRREAAAVHVRTEPARPFPEPPAYRLDDAPPAEATRPSRFFVLGNPNCGKSTLFGALSGKHVRVANHPGITVDAQAAVLTASDLALVDLPGCYSLVGSAASSPEEVLAARRVAADPEAALLVVLDATALERGLYLALQALELGRPMVCAVNLLDEAERAGLEVDLAGLSAWLGVPFVGTVATKRRGLAALRALLLSVPAPKKRAAPPVADLEAACVARYAEIDRNCARLVVRPDKARVRLTDRVDAVLTHPLSGSLVFVLVLALMFGALFTLSQPLMDAITFGFQRLGSWLSAHLPTYWLSDLVSGGLMSGVGTTVAFLPQIALLLLFITLLESIGYLSRAAFLIDRVMRAFGLSGKAFVPMLSGYACAVPAILSLRTLERRRDRILTMLVVPLMSCSARLPVYTLILATLFSAQQRWLFLPVSAWLLLALYAVSAAFAFAALGVLSRTVTPREPSRLVLELPPYRLPDPRLVLRIVARRSGDFLQTAGTIIVLLSGLLWVGLHYPNPPSRHASPAERAAALEHSYAGRVGHAIEPVFAPLGFDWKIDVGLVGSFAAREVFVATMGVIHGQDGDDPSSLAQALQSDRRASGEKIYTPRTVLSLLLFFMLACQCTSTLAVMHRETGTWRWPAFAFFYMTVLAYGVSFVAYHLPPALLGSVHAG